MKYWQVAAGSESRDYSGDFLKYGLAFVGGPQPIATMQQVEAGDRLILRRGLSQMLAAGVVVERGGVHGGDARSDGETREWLQDYDGWDLPAYCYVDWFRESSPRSVTGLSRGTIRQALQPQLRAAADEIVQAGTKCEISPEPGPAGRLDDDEMLGFLVRLGLRPANAEELTDTLRRIRLLARYYYGDCHWDDIREHEARTFLIIPFLIALGWSEQQIKIELGVKEGRIDIACFSRPYRRDRSTGQPNNAECVLLLESKGFSKGLDYAHGQGKEYAAQFPNCDVVVASNGYCYKAYRRRPDGSGFDDTPSAYLNLLRPRKSYPLDPGKSNGGLELLSHLIPQKA